ncbi:MAG: efflux RND transporter permease subunit [Elusimicrobiota bacterium]
MTLSDISIKRPVFAWMLMLGLILFGWLGFSQMGISLLPDVDFPVVTVSIAWEGASPEVIETEVTDVIEDVVMTVQGVKEISSSSRQGRSRVSIEFELNRDIDVALQEVQTKVAQAQRTLPRDIDPAVITKTNPEDMPIMWLSLSGNRPLKYLMEFANERLKDQFTTVTGVGEVFMGGFVEPNLRVWLNADEMRKKELTVDDIIAAIQMEHSEVPAGIIETEKKELNVRVLGEASSVEEFGKIIIPGRKGSPIYRTFRLKDVATIEDGLADVRRISRFNGIISVGFGIRKQRGSNAVEVARLIKKKITEIQKTLPAGLNLDVSFDSTKFIEESTRELIFILILSATLTSFVCWLFLGSWSSALNIILAIPTSIVGSFLFLYFMGFTLNTFTLLGLALVIGIVVDDAIMVLENIVRHREAGEPRVKAAIVGAREITFAALAATISILAIFIPVIFMKGVIGKYFFQFGVTLSVAVLLSLLEALTLAPMRCSQFLEVGHTTLIGRGMDNLMNVTRRSYRTALFWCLNNRWKVIVIAFVFFSGSLYLAKILKSEFIPAQDQGRFMVRLQTPVGSSMEFTDKLFKQAEELVASKPEVEKYFASIGGFGGTGVNTGVIFLTMKPLKDRPLTGKRKHHITQREFMSVIRKEIKEIRGFQRVTVQDPSTAGIGSRGFPIEFTLRGRDWEKLASLSETLMGNMEFSGFMTK